MDRKIRDEILDIRSTGLANMLDIPYVQRLAFDRNYLNMFTSSFMETAMRRCNLHNSGG